MTATRLFLWIGFATFLNGCMLAPGMQALNLKRSDSVFSEDIISPDDGSAIPNNIKTINAELIVRLKEQLKLSSDPQGGAMTSRSKLKVEHSNKPSARLPMTEFDRMKLKAAQTDYTYAYRVGPADVLTIVVWEHPELTIPAGAERAADQAGNVVGSDGSIYFPYAGVVQVEGKTLSEIRDLLTNKLSRYIEDVKLDVRVAQYNHKRVYVVGEVKQPSAQPITNIPPTLIEMVNASGGFTENADSQTLTLTRKGKTYRVDLLALYEKGDTTQNILLKPGDVVNVWDRSGTKLFVLGEVNAPGSYYVNKGRKSLAEALSDAGGINPDTSNPGQVFVFRQQKEQAPAVFHLNANSPDALLLADQFPLKSRDVVYVDAAKVVRWNRLIQNIAGTMSTLNQATQTDFPLFQGGIL